MKTKITVSENEEVDDAFPMTEMEPLQVCIVAEGMKYEGHCVMRTASRIKFEVMDLSSPGKDQCWDERNSLKVRPAPVGTKIIIEVTE